MLDIDDSLRGLWYWPFLVIAALSLWRLLLAVILPVMQDEAYYLHWARHLAWGYFDHPPGVALLGTTAALSPVTAPVPMLLARLGTWLAGSLTLLVLWRFYRRCGLTDSRDGPGALSLALLIAGASLPGFASGLLTTPDTLLALCWALALHEALAALRGQRWRWLSAGLVTGLGLLGKYGMAVIGPVFLWVLLLADRRALRGPWPYLGGLLAVLVFLPNLLWNARYHWLTIGFQFAHGFSMTATLPELATRALPSALELVTAIPTAFPAPDVLERGARLGVFLASQLALLGWLLPPLLAAFVPTRARQTSGWRHWRQLSAPAVPSLLSGATLVPLLLFGLIATGSDVESNWAALYLTGAAPLFALASLDLKRWVMLGALANLLCIGLYSLHAATAILPLPNSQERILRETHGFDRLATEVAKLPGPLFADRYQIAAMLNFYQSAHGVGQWPGITRPSEYARGTLVAIPDLAALRASGFWLVTSKPRPAEIPGFRVIASQALVDCKGQVLEAVPIAVAEVPPPRCPKPLHVWRIDHYEAAD